MFATHEIALLVAVALPVAAILALNLWLFAFGERGTLLLPGLGRFPAIALDKSAPAEDALVEDGIVVVEEEPLRKAA
jgi:hypothetical protein